MRNPGAEARRGAAEQTVIALEWENGNCRTLFHRQQPDATLPDLEFTSDELMFAASRLGDRHGSVQPVA